METWTAMLEAFPTKIFPEFKVESSFELKLLKSVEAMYPSILELPRLTATLVGFKRELLPTIVRTLEPVSVREAKLLSKTCPTDNELFPFQDRGDEVESLELLIASLAIVKTPVSLMPASPLMSTSDDTPSKLPTRIFRAERCEVCLELKEFQSFELR